MARKTFCFSHLYTISTFQTTGKKFVSCFNCLVYVFFLFRFAQSVYGVRVVEPLNLGSPGMPSGHMTSPCVMTVPNSLLKVSDEHMKPRMLITVTVN